MLWSDVIAASCFLIWPVSLAFFCHHPHSSLTASINCTNSHSNHSRVQNPSSIIYLPSSILPSLLPNHIYTHPRPVHQSCYCFLPIASRPVCIYQQFIAMGGDHTGHTYSTRAHGPPEYSEECSNMATRNASAPHHKCYNKIGYLSATWIDWLCNRHNRGTLQCPSAKAHTLHMIPTQTSHIMGRLVCICEHCKRTLTFLIEFLGHECCPLLQSNHPMHHLVNVQEFNTAPGKSPFYPLIANTVFRCSAYSCSLNINVHTCDRRLDIKWDEQLLDRNAATDRLAYFVMNDPGRFEELGRPENEARYIPAYYLQAYLRDALKPNPGRNRVSLRNKFFMALFARQFEQLFLDLGFTPVTDGGENFLALPEVEPPPPPNEATPYDSKRAYLEVIRAHLYCLLLKEPPLLLDQLRRKPDEIDIPNPLATQQWLTARLKADYSKSKFPDSPQYPDSAFDVLGALRDMPNLLVWYAAECRNQTNPSGRKFIYFALNDVGGQQRAAVLQQLRDFLDKESIYLAMEASKEEAELGPPLSKAYTHFELSETCSDIALSARFAQDKSQWNNQPERQRMDRQSLLRISKARLSKDLQKDALQFDTPQQAADFLGIDLDAAMDPRTGSQAVQDQYETLGLDRFLTVAALKALALPDTGSPASTALLSLAHYLQSQAGDSAVDEPPSGPPTGTDSGGSGADPVDLSRPAGLTNIRNTCYLNSLLQYFNTVMPVRNLILNWEEHKLDRTEANLNSRRLDLSDRTLDAGAAFLAAQFVEEIRNLFLALQNTDQEAVRPTQRLAIAALKNVNRLVTDHTKKETVKPVHGPEKPPTLPPRPSSGSPANAPTGPTVSVNQVVDNTDTSSDVSSVTLGGPWDDDDEKSYVQLSESARPAVPAKERSAIEEDDKDKAEENEPALRGRSATRGGAADVNMHDASGSSDIPPVGDTQTLEDGIQAALNDKNVTGTGQEDVSEVMDNMLNHLQAAIRPFGTDELLNAQADMITETFFCEVRQSIVNLDLQTGQVIPGSLRFQNDRNRYTSANPGEGRGDLYAALDRGYFDRCYAEAAGYAAMYWSITKLPPIIHICIQRNTMNANGVGLKNNNIVVIPETLYLDRYMYGNADSDITRRRQRSWDLKGRLQILENPLATMPPTTQADETDETGEAVQDADYEMIDAHLDEFAEALISADAGEGDGHEGYLTITSAAAVNLDYTASNRAQALVKEEKEKIQEELSALFSDLKGEPYSLHAVICHSGGVGGGHYWVWIYDFQQRVWRKYNDELVSDPVESVFVLSVLNESAHPYYLAYVRNDKVDELFNDKIDELVTIPERTASASNKDEQQNAGGGQTDTGTQISQPLPIGRPQPPVSVQEPMQTVEDVIVMHVEDRNNE